ncbi:MAG: polysaccharide deacetylase family protein [Albidovulum sp.]
MRDRGFEVGIHTWDHIRWQDHVARRDAAWTREEMSKAVERFAEIFGTAPRTHGAAGWQMNDAAYALEREFGFDYASDGRGTRPFQPVDRHGESVGVPQLPTTLPTLDELIGIDGLDAGQCAPARAGAHRGAAAARPRLHAARRARGHEAARQPSNAC